MNRSTYDQTYSMSPETVMLFAVVQGAGAAAPVIPTTTFSATSSKGYASASNNYASGTAGDIVRSAVGVYTMKLKDGIPVVLDVCPDVWGPNGTKASLLDYNPTTRILSFNTWTVAGAAVDLAATEFARFTILGQLSVI